MSAIVTEDKNARLEIKYKCLHPSCCVNCREGYVWIDEDAFLELKKHYPEKDVFRSPKNACRLGHSQPYKALNIEPLTKKPAPSFYLIEDRPVDFNDPIDILMGEHKEILKSYEVLDERLRLRDMEGLWQSTNDMENVLMLHSGLKEEDVVMPALADMLPFGEGLIVVVREEHREILSLLYAFRTAMLDGIINDGVLKSMLQSLRSHIRKEDNEFFNLVDRKSIPDEVRLKMLEGMKRMEDTFVPKKAGDRAILTEEQRKASIARAAFNDEILDAVLNNLDGCCH